ncbi:hypothetical protein DFR49_1890 [Hephaestia caeni]|uniref:Uncharacterized protein n=1 Tax=Hephaestia caeni TaxID=645617 RepID=A0A397PC24_9SPHN|nr:hypothetical protein [Hephaestia caeni]RIA43664.1 hypothetical protein DFR49_1890 [Hephaestia caeni]
MSEVDEQIARSNELLNRTSERYRSLSSRRRERQKQTLVSRLGRIAAADIAILLGAMVLGWFVPLGIGGAMLVMLLLLVATIGFAIFPSEATITTEKLDEAPLKYLPMRTEQWLERQRGTLPTSAQRLLDGIGQRLETLGPQLVNLDDASPAASEVRKLVGDNLPELVKGYGRVPEPLRRVERNGKTPDQQLLDGLGVIDREIAQMTRQLAEGDLDLLATRGRYLEIKYQGDDTIEG